MKSVSGVFIRDSQFTVKEVIFFKTLIEKRSLGEEPALDFSLKTALLSVIPV